jgi:Ca2+-binding EF-hand superfamily protein
MKFYDADGDGNITYDEFISGLRDELSERRLVMVKKAFAMLDKDGSGELTVNDIAGIYDVSMNAEFLEGKKTKDEILMEFLNNFDGSRGNNDGKVSWNEWIDYYSDLSMSTPSEEYFVRMMESTW